MSRKWQTKLRLYALCRNPRLKPAAAATTTYIQEKIIERQFENRSDVNGKIGMYTAIWNYNQIKTKCARLFLYKMQSIASKYGSAETSSGRSVFILFYIYICFLLLLCAPRYFCLFICAIEYIFCMLAYIGDF